jgi:hypothetical protein
MSPVLKQGIKNRRSSFKGIIPPDIKLLSGKWGVATYEAMVEARGTSGVGIPKLAYLV